MRGVLVCVLGLARAVQAASQPIGAPPSVARRPARSAHLTRPSARRAARAGLCQIFESKLKELNPNIRNITYDITDLYTWVDRLPDLGAMVWNPQTQAYTVRWRVACCAARPFPAAHGRSDSDSFRSGARGAAGLGDLRHERRARCSVPLTVRARALRQPYNKDWLKQRIFQHLKKQARQ